MRFEAHPLMAMRFVSHETRIRETQSGLPCMGEPQKIAGGVSAPCPAAHSDAAFHE